MMLKCKQILERFGMHWFLLPVFFILHNYIQYYGLVSGAVAVRTLGEIELIFLLSFLILLGITRNMNRSAAIITLLGFVILFYGVGKDFLNNTIHAHILSKYAVLFPLLTIAIVLLLIQIFKKKDFKRINFFQNLLLILFILFDGWQLPIQGNTIFIRHNLLVKKNILTLDKLPIPSQKPDVYYLLFDCYPGTNFLHDILQYDNSGLDTALQEKGFHVIPKPTSNYNRTAFSIASTLNFEYLKNITDYTPVKSKDYNQAQLSIKYAMVPQVFGHAGYKIYNLSVFDLEDQPAVYKETFLTLPEQQMLLYNTLVERIKNDILWNFRKEKPQTKSTVESDRANLDDFAAEQIKKRDFTNTVIDSLQKIPSLQTGQPKFIYAHFYLPHPPFFYDKNGKSNSTESIMSETAEKDKTRFLSYLEYTNKVMLKITDRLLNGPGKKPVIIIQSDHGFGDLKDGAVVPQLHFKNYSAFFFPDKNYSMLYDSLSNINTFPIIFNTYFNTSIPMQKDSSFFLTY